MPFFLHKLSTTFSLFMKDAQKLEYFLLVLLFFYPYDLLFAISPILESFHSAID